jgi:hypothetical protein
MTERIWLSVLVPLALRQQDLPERFPESCRRLLLSLQAQSQTALIEVIFSDSGRDASLANRVEREIVEIHASPSLSSLRLIYRRWMTRDSPFSRAKALNLALQESQGELIMIAHLDCELGDSTLLALRRAEAEGVVAGGFIKDYDAKPVGSWLYWTEAWLNQHRAAKSRHLVGTNAMFLTRGLALEHPFRGVFLEDVELSDWLRTRVPPKQWRLLPVPVRVSARKYRAHGELRAIAVNGLVMLLFRLFRVSPRHLSRQLYRRTYPEGPLFWWVLFSALLRCIDKAGLGPEEWRA